MSEELNDPRSSFKEDPLGRMEEYTIVRTSTGPILFHNKAYCPKPGFTLRNKIGHVVEAIPHDTNLRELLRMALKHGIDLEAARSNSEQKYKSSHRGANGQH